MEGHPALIDADDLARVLKVKLRLIKQHEAQPPAEYDAQDRPGQKEIDLLFAGRRGVVGPERGAAQVAQQETTADEDHRQIGQRVPAQGKLDPENRE